METSLTSPRPLPAITETPFSQRKRTPFRSGKFFPRSPAAKSCPPVSRVFSSGRDRRKQLGPRFISFKAERERELSGQDEYDPTCRLSYFDQCFDVLEKLGEGSFGEVFKVRSKRDGKLYAIKKSRFPFRGAFDRRQKLAEVERHQQLPNHPNCIEFVQAWEEGDNLYIQIELCEMSLAEYADLLGRIPEKKLWNILVDLVKGLKHLHDHRLCHFDIKPANLFLGLDGHFKLGDFGLCVSLDHGLSDALEGDAKYMAAELMRGEFSKAADVFSLGISLVEVACDLELPSSGSNWHMLRRGKVPPEFTKGISADLQSVLLKMMDPEPSLRPSVDELLNDKRLRESYLWHDLFYRIVRSTSTTLHRFCGYISSLILVLLFFLPSGKPLRHSTSTLSSSHTVKHNNSFSDDDEEVMNAHNTNGSPNCSFIQGSPLSFPQSLYAGPPIPINFDLAESPHRRCTNTSPDQSVSSHNSSFSSCTPNPKPSMGEAVTLKGLSIGPRNLMDVFCEADQ